MKYWKSGCWSMGLQAAGKRRTEGSTKCGGRTGKICLSNLLEGTPETTGRGELFIWYRLIHCHIPRYHAARSCISVCLGKYSNNVPNRIWHRTIDIRIAIAARPSFIHDQSTKYHASTSSPRPTWRSTQVQRFRSGNTGGSAGRPTVSR